MGKKLTIGLLFVVLIGLSGYLGYHLYTLSQSYSAQTRELNKISHRATLLQQKYTAQKARTAALQRAKLTVEGLKRQAEMKTESLKKQLEKQAAKINAMEKKSGANVKALEAELAEKDEQIAQWEEKYTTLSDTHRQARKTIKERDATIAKKEENTRQLESDLQFVQRTRDRYRANNQKMAATAQSILARYDEKGVFASSILDVEPFTQIKKVELEQLIQEYLDQIDDQIIRDRE